MLGKESSFDEKGIVWLAKKTIPSFIPLGIKTATPYMSGLPKEGELVSG
jgi:hypothetical protein